MRRKKERNRLVVGLDFINRRNQNQGGRTSNVQQDDADGWQEDAKQWRIYANQWRIGAILWRPRMTNTVSHLVIRDYQRLASALYFVLDLSQCKSLLINQDSASEHSKLHCHSRIFQNDIRISAFLEKSEINWQFWKTISQTKLHQFHLISPSLYIYMYKFCSRRYKIWKYYIEIRMNESNCSKYIYPNFPFCFHMQLRRARPFHSHPHPSSLTRTPVWFGTA